jgi:hypothetical protein
VNIKGALRAMYSVSGRLLVCAASFLACPSASFALGTQDVGMYRLLNVRAQPTATVFQLVRTGDEWKILWQQQEGNWIDVTCEADCRLRPSSAADLKRFFPGDDLTKVDMSCLHNKAFAFCRYMTESTSREPGYVVVTLTTVQPVWLKLRRE